LDTSSFPPLPAEFKELNADDRRLKAMDSARLLD
jgi:hypothetical protein